LILSPIFAGTLIGGTSIDHTVYSTVPREENFITFSSRGREHDLQPAGAALD